MILLISIRPFVSVYLHLEPTHLDYFLYFNYFLAVNLLHFMLSTLFRSFQKKEFRNFGKIRFGEDGLEHLKTLYLRINSGSQRLVLDS